MLVELLKPLAIPPTSKAPDSFTTSDKYGAQKKYDGVRLSIAFDGKTVISYNRKGQIVETPTALAKVLKTHGLPMHVDGEYLSATKEYVMFDVLSMDGSSTVNDPYFLRHRFLQEFGPKGFTLAPLAVGTKDKLALLQTQIEQGGERHRVQEAGRALHAGTSRRQHEAQALGICDCAGLREA